MYYSGRVVISDREEMKFLLIFIGGGVGSLLRFLMSTSIQNLLDGWIFPIGTFLVNMTGCLVIGLLAGLAESRGIFTGDVRALLFVGLLGGFTTFSSFGYETFQLLRDGQIAFALVNGFLQLFLGIGSVWIGYVIAKLL